MNGFDRDVAKKRGRRQSRQCRQVESRTSSMVRAMPSREVPAAVSSVVGW